MADKSIAGVGVSRKPRSKPASTVPREEFEIRAGLSADEQQPFLRRVRTETRSAILIKPVLVDGKRGWRFRSALEGEFGASIKDSHFLDGVLSGEVPILMRSNLELTLELEIVEESRDGVWFPIERNILRIIGVPRQSNDDQPSFDFGHQK